MAVLRIYTVFAVISGILALDSCSDTSSNCQYCGTNNYPRDQTYRQNCMKTCDVCSDINVALGKPTKQSTTLYYGTVNSSSSNAVDGNTDRKWLNGHCTHTRNNTSHWWCVDLEQIYNIGTIKVFNRDKLKERLRGFEVKTSSSDSCDGSGFNSATSCYIDTPTTTQDVYTINACNEGSSASISARTVYIGVTTQYLILCEVQIFAVTNVAYSKPTNQSSTYIQQNDGGSRSEPSHAVDGNTSRVWGGAMSCSHTLIGNPSWWCVDLHQIYNIASMKFFNRDNCKCTCTSIESLLSGFEIKLGSDGQCNGQGFTSATSCYINRPLTNRSVYTIDTCNQQSSTPLSARTVFVSVSSGFVALCEVQIFTDLVQCNPGYYSISSSTCQPCNTCLNNRCNRTSGVCTDGCKDTYYGTKCTSSCSNKCSNSRCSTTSSSLSPQCTTGCIDGYTGSYCQSTCPDNCKSCQQYGSSCNECNLGWYGTSCQQKCSSGCVNELCEKLGGTCGCKDTYYGDKCTLSCSDNCTNSRCYTTSSFPSPQCTTGCVDGYRGSYCQSTCPDKCTSCHRDGSPCNECNQGWYGTKCESGCPGNCVGGCGKIDGRCKDCKPDAVGPYCNLTCGKECQKGTDQPATCDKDGKCANCIVGKYGDRCDMNCSTECAGGCNRSTGKCATCIKGKSGDKCNTNCNDNCTVCNQNNINSCTECKDGKWGQSCNKQCNMNCTTIIGTIVGKCNITSGLCSEWCKLGTYGTDCNMDCSSNCKDGSCHQMTGNCNNGCLPGKKGSHCTKDCEAGKYGENCESKCGNCAQNAPCDILYGNCGHDGCDDGFRGSRCQEKITDGASILSPIAIGVIGILCGIVGMVAVVLSYHFYKKRCQSSQPKTENDPDNVYCNTDLNPARPTTDDTLAPAYQNIHTNTRNVEYENQSFNTEDNTRNIYDALDHTSDNANSTYTTLDSN